MKKKSKSARNEEKTGDQTASLSSSNFHLTLSNLLGEAELNKPSESLALLRVASGMISEKFREQLKLENFPSHLVGEASADQIRFPVVLGPFKLEDLKTYAGQGFLRSSDAILVSYNRWKAPKAFFPGLGRGFGGGEELTETSTMERTGSLSTDFGSLEVDAIDDIKNSKDSDLRISMANTVEKKPSIEEEIALDLDNTVPVDTEVRPLRVSIENTELGRRRDQAAEKPKNKKLQSQSKGFSWTAAIASFLVVLLGGTVYKLYNTRLQKDSSRATVLPNPGPPDIKTRSWPENLRPQAVDSLYADDDALMKKLRPILLAYERGATIMSANDEQILRALIDPASASWKARLNAANQLAVFYLAKSRLEDARKILQPILEASQNDPTTLLNDALLRLAEGDASGAKESASAALRLCPPGMLWEAYSILGIISASSGRSEEAEKNFESALARSPGNPFIYGMWIQSLNRSELAKRRIPILVREALWSDPDRLVDSPIRAPLAGHILVAEALAGFKRALELASFTPGQTAFLRWIDARNSMNPIGENATKVANILAGESNPQSQILFSYLLKEQGKLDAAADILGRTVPLLEGQKIVSSWPWSFAGDIQHARGQMDQALIYYQSALSRNPQDASAVLGLALSFREIGDFQASEQKFAESISLNPYLTPALLRIDRFEWHRRARTQ